MPPPPNPKLSRIERTAPWVVLALLASGVLLMLFSLLPQRWFEAPPKPPRPLALELIQPARTASARPTHGMSVGHTGFATLLSAPPRRLIPSPKPAEADAPAHAEKPPVTEQLGGLIRLFARLMPAPVSNELVNFSMEEPSPYFTTIILRDGCLRLAEPGEPHAIFPAGAKLYIDTGGFLTAGVQGTGAATDPRVGEPAWSPGGARLPIDAAAIAQIRAKCGRGAVRIIGPAQSVAASQAASDEIAARNLVNRYGLPWATAMSKVRECRIRLAVSSGIDPARMIYNACGSTPPSPVADARSCPAGTSLSGGLCRTPSGHIRPVPPL